MSGTCTVTYTVTMSCKYSINGASGKYRHSKLTFSFLLAGPKKKGRWDCDATWVHLQIYGMLLGMLWTLKSPASSESKLQTVMKKNGFLDVLLGKIQRENWWRHGRAIMFCHVFAYQHVHCAYIVLMCLRCMFAVKTLWRLDCIM